MQIQGAMCLVAVQKNGNRCDGNMGESQYNNYITPPWQINKT